MQLVYLTFTDIHRDEDAFAAWKEQMKAVLTNYANDPQFIFSDSLSATLYNHNIMREPLKAEDIDLINYDRILEIAKERTANAADYTFIFVGNFDIDSLKPVVENKKTPCAVTLCSVCSTKSWTSYIPKLSVKKKAEPTA